MEYVWKRQLQVPEMSINLPHKKRPPCDTHLMGFHLRFIHNSRKEVNNHADARI